MGSKEQARQFRVTIDLDLRTGAIAKLQDCNRLVFETRHICFTEVVKGLICGPSPGACMFLVLPLERTINQDIAKF